MGWRCLHARTTLGSHCCLLITNCIQDPIWAHCNNQNQREPTMRNRQDSRVLNEQEDCWSLVSYMFVPWTPFLHPSNNRPHSAQPWGRQMQRSLRCSWIHFGLAVDNKCLWLSNHSSVRGIICLSTLGGFSIFWYLAYTLGYRLTSVTSRPAAASSIVLVSRPQ